MHRNRSSLFAVALAAVVASVTAPPIAAAAQTTTPIAPAPSQQPLTTTQLPRDVAPTDYELSVTPHAEALRFDGRANVGIDVLATTTSITLNAIDLRFDSVRLVTGEREHATSVAPRKIAIDASAQTATFSFAQPIAPGHYRLAVNYTGKINTQAIGLFAIDYPTPNGKRRALYTQFENSDARRFMPCWDEPAHKATFTFEAIVPSGQMTISNMPVEFTRAAGNGLSRVRFATTPKMSTYLLFFGTGDFERVAERDGATEIGVVTRKGVSSQAAFALESAKAVLREYNDYFDEPYPLPKLDNVASPGSNQFFGAMENWGAIFTFEHGLLLDPSISTLQDRQVVFETAAHEIAHQWFGNLVTMRWWDDLWLNEGFASWLTARTTERLHPEWDTALDAVGKRTGAMRVDALQTTHPVIQHVATVDEAQQAFDSIAYGKGEAVVRMLEAYVGPEHWRDGVRRYIKAHAYGSTVTDDLWREVDAVTEAPISSIAHDFTLQAGVPLLRIESTKCEAGDTTVHLGQGQFSADHPDRTALAWRIPVIAQIAGHPQKRTLVVDGHATLVLPGCGALVVNAGQTGYYRSLYAPAELAAIQDGFAKLPAIDQLGLIDDEWALGMAGYQPTSDVLDLVARTPVDSHPELWGDIALRLGTLDPLFRSDPQRQAKLRAFAISRLAPVFARVGWQPSPNETVPQTILRTRLIDALSQFGDVATIAEARRRYARAATDASAVPAALRKSIVGAVALHADAATWEQLRKAAKAEKTPLVKDRLYALLSSVEDDSLALQALELAVTNEPGATSSASMVRAVSRNHPDLALDFAVAHREQVNAMVDASNRDSFLPYLGAESQNPATATKIQAFAEAHIAPQARHAADAVIAGIHYRAVIVSERLPSIGVWLDRNPG